MTASPPPAGPRTQEITTPSPRAAHADPAGHGATAVGAADPHPAPLPPPAYPVTAPQSVAAQPVAAEASTAVVPPVGHGDAGGVLPTGPIDPFSGAPPAPPGGAPSPAAAAPTARVPVAEPARAPRTPRDRAVLITTGLGVLGLVLLELGLALRLGGKVLWTDLPLWSAFATLAALTGIAGLAAGLLPGRRVSPAAAETPALGGLAGLAVFWLLIALPRVDSDRGFLLTAALGALGVAVWLSPTRRRSTARA